MRAAIRKSIEAAQTRAVLPPPIAIDPSEALLTPKDVARTLATSPDTVKRIFRAYPGTVFLHGSGSAYRQMRIPPKVLKLYLEKATVR